MEQIFPFFASKMQKNGEFQIPFLKDHLCLAMIRLYNIYGKAGLHERDMNFFLLSLSLSFSLSLTLSLTISLSRTLFLSLDDSRFEFPWVDLESPGGPRSNVAMEIKNDYSRKKSKFKDENFIPAFQRNYALLTLLHPQGGILCLHSYS